MRGLTRKVLLVLSISAVASSAFSGQFSGKVEFAEKGCEKKGLCVLKSKFGYIDSSGQGWEAKAGNKTDGASIPPELQGWFGSPFDADLIRAAVIHDHYCDRHVHSWSDTHWVFYDALLASGVDKSRAELMWAGVLLGGPKWIWLVQGVPCKTGENCLQQVTASAPLPAGGTGVRRDGKSTWYRAPRYQDPEFKKEMNAIKTRLSGRSGALTRKDMEDMVKALRPTDPFINGPDKISRPAAGGIDR